MNLEECRKELIYNGIPKDWYCLGGEAQYCDCLLHENGKWIIFNLERGKRSNIQSFDSEDAACRRLLEMEQTLYNHKREQFNKRQKSRNVPRS